MTSATFWRTTPCIDVPRYYDRRTYVDLSTQKQVLQSTVRLDLVTVAYRIYTHAHNQQAGVLYFFQASWLSGNTVYKKNRGEGVSLLGGGCVYLALRDATLTYASRHDVGCSRSWRIHTDSTSVRNISELKNQKKNYSPFYTFLAGHELAQLGECIFFRNLNM